MFLASLLRSDLAKDEVILVEFELLVETALRLVVVAVVPADVLLQVELRGEAEQLARPGERRVPRRRVARLTGRDTSGLCLSMQVVVVVK